MKTTRLSLARLSTTFEGLVKFHPPRPIHDRVGYDNTAEIVDVLAVAGPRLNADQADYLELLSTLIERSDAEHTGRLPASSGLDLLKYLLDEHQLGGDGLAQILGVDRSIAYRILKGERRLTAAHIKALGARFAVPADLFL
ncbi:MAG: transcriptional regulator [Opitutus sp.]|nr:transcriptional regulator [Opitutus sp.]